MVTSLRWPLGILTSGLRCFKWLNIMILIHSGSSMTTVCWFMRLTGEWRRIGKKQQLYITPVLNLFIQIHWTNQGSDFTRCSWQWYWGSVSFRSRCDWSGESGRQFQPALRRIWFASVGHWVWLEGSSLWGVHWNNWRSYPTCHWAWQLLSACFKVCNLYCICHVATILLIRFLYFILFPYIIVMRGSVASSNGDSGTNFTGSLALPLPLVKMSIQMRLD